MSSNLKKMCMNVTPAITRSIIRCAFSCLQAAVRAGTLLRQTEETADGIGEQFFFNMKVKFAKHLSNLVGNE